MDALLQTIIDRKKEIATGSAAVIAGVAILIGYFQSGPDASTYARAEIAFAEWEASPQDEGLYQEMRKAVQKAPALERKYEAALAQKLLNTERIGEALQMANRSIQRAQSDIPFHASYAEATLLVEQKSYQKALENAVALKEQMGRSFDLKQLADPLVGGSFLYAHNLLRIACLQQELKNRPGEKAAWEELEAFLQGGESLSALVLDAFSDKQLRLTQYIADRKKAL